MKIRQLCFASRDRHIACASSSWQLRDKLVSAMKLSHVALLFSIGFVLIQLDLVSGQDDDLFDDIEDEEGPFDRDGLENYEGGDAEEMYQSRRHSRIASDEDGDGSSCSTCPQKRLLRAIMGLRSFRLWTN